MFSHAGIHLVTTDSPGEVRRRPSGHPIFTGLRPSVLNLILTGYVPPKWDNGRALSGVTTFYDGYLVSVIALRYAHGNQVPWFGVNTVTHELLHAFMQDVFISHPGWWKSATRESAVDSHATGLWLFHSGAAVRQSAAAYLRRMAAR
jgi:hypothetical protein